MGRHLARPEGLSAIVVVDAKSMLDVKVGYLVASSTFSWVVMRSRTSSVEL